MEFDRLHDNVLAQVFLQLLGVSCGLPIAYIYLILSQPAATAEMNRLNECGGSRIYGILTNFDQFNFYSYNPATNKFYFDETMVVNLERKIAFSDMMDGMCFSQWKLFRIEYLPSFQ